MPLTLRGALKRRLEGREFEEDIEAAKAGDRMKA